MQYIKNTMHYIFGLGVPREKLVLGLAGYGRSMMLSDPNCITDGCPVQGQFIVYICVHLGNWQQLIALTLAIYTGAGLGGCHGEAGNLPYFQIDEEFIQTGNYDSLVLNEVTGSMELITGGNACFTSYDSPETLGIKYRYAFHECLRGIMWWAVDLVKEPIDLLGEYQPSTSPSASMSPSTTTRSPSTPPTMAPTVRCGSQCPSGASGFFPTMDCSGYFECKDGVVTSSVIMCHGGLVFNEEYQRCDWDYNTQCQCTTEMFPPTTAHPTQKPSAKPTPKPTKQVTIKPTTKSVTSKPSPKPVTTQPTSNDNEMEQQSSSTNTKPETEVVWYPVPDGYCVNGGDPPENVALSASIKECCNRFFSASNKSCSLNSKRWYPDYASGHCKNDGNQPQNVAMSETYKTCCDRFMFSESDQCYVDSNAFESGGNYDMQQNSSSTGSGSGPQQDVYYPDYYHSTCRNDGHAPEFETNFFSSFEACCEFAWIDTENCLASESTPEWFPLSDGSCTSGGTPPLNIALSETLDECCGRFFPYSDCIYRSNYEMNQNTAGANASDCQSLNKRKCNRDQHCSWNEDSLSCSSNVSYESINGCQAHNKRQCKRNSNSCKWDEVASVCTSHTR